MRGCYIEGVLQICRVSQREGEGGGRRENSKEGEIEGAWEKGRDRRKIKDRESKSEKE